MELYDLTIPYEPPLPLIKYSFAPPCGPSWYSTFFLENNPFGNPSDNPFENPLENNKINSTDTPENNTISYDNYNN